MRRRDFLKMVGAASLTGVHLLAPARAEDAPAAAPAAPLEIGHAPQLFLDDFLIERLGGLTRRVQRPERRDQPVLDSQTFGTTQPYITVLRDADQNRLRIWYNRGPSVWHADSEDGIHWAHPRAAWEIAHGYGASVVEASAPGEGPDRRYKLATWQAPRDGGGKHGDASGMYVGFSADGLRWTPCRDNPVLPSWPDGPGKVARHGVGDIVDAFYDPLRRHNGVAVKLHALPEDGYLPGPRAGKVFRRLVGLSTSKDFVHWEKPWRIFTPDDRDEGLLEFYGMGAVHQRGPLSVGLVRVLRDDLACDPGGPKDGIGYSVLATSRDGVTWQRYREPFLDRNPERGSWDHAMTWIGAVLPMGDEVLFYYGGYARGHKVAAATERQIGLARLRRDRYLALTPAREEGTLRTRPFLLPGGRLTVNVRTEGGEVRVRLLDAHGPAGDNSGGREAKPITGDHLAAELRWPEAPRPRTGTPVRLEFDVRQAALFGFEFQAT